MMRTLAIALAALAFAGCDDRYAAPSLPAAPQTRAPATAALKFRVFTAGRTQGFPAGAVAADIAPDASGNVWFTDYATPAIGKIAADGSLTEYTQGLMPGALPMAIIPGPDGNMWFSDYGGVAIGKVTPAGAITEFSSSQYGGTKTIGIAFRRGHPWLLGYGAQPLLGHLTAGGTIAIRLLPPHVTTDPAFVSDSAGNLWFAALKQHLRGEIAELPARDFALMRLPLHMKHAFAPCCVNQAPRTMIVGPNGDPWFTTLYYIHKSSPAQFIGTVASGSVKLFRLTYRGLTKPAIASGIAADQASLWISGDDPFGNDGALWQIDAKGKQSAVSVPYSPYGLAVDGRGRPWFTSFFSGLPSQIVEVLTR
ncbi:MAG: hypothetical protein JO078_03080 [Candidatus Eremiobacteraeota bacterium]|nr:hypothetical protein [Candidatus Eremiobacteraeota bacterium]